MEIIWIRRARADVRELFDDIDEHNPAAAEKVAERLYDAAKPLADFPRYGTEIEELPGLYKIVVTRTPYLIIYRIEPDQNRVLMLRVIHGKRNWRKLFGQTR